MASEQRLFPAVPIGVVGTVEQAFGHRVTCTVKGCSEVETIKAGAKSSAGGLPDDVVTKKAKQRGWVIRRGGRDRRCPTHSGGGRLELPGDDRHGIVGTSCCISGCPARLTIPRGGRRWPMIGGEVKVPRSVVAQVAKSEGWAAVGGDLVCATHLPGYASAKIVLRSITDPAGMRQALLRDCAPDCTTPDACVQDALNDAEERAAAAYGEAWPGMKAQAADIRAARQRVITPAAPAAPSEEAPMPTPPREPTRDDKRRINAQLTDCCADDGYSSDWSDAKVAATLAVPVAWVAAIRSEFFTDHDSNEASRAEARQNRRALNELHSDFKVAKATLDKALGTLAEAERTLTALQSRMAKLEGKI